MTPERAVRLVARRSTIRIVAAAASILLVPLLAMQFTDEVVWSLADFAVAGALLVGTGLMFQMALRQAGDLAYRAAAGVALAAPCSRAFGRQAWPARCSPWRPLRRWSA